MSLRHSSTCAGTSIRGFRFVAATSAVAVMLCACAGANRSAYRSPPDPNVQDVLSDTAQRRQVTPAAPAPQPVMVASPARPRLLRLEGSPRDYVVVRGNGQPLLVGGPAAGTNSAGQTFSYQRELRLAPSSPNEFVVYELASGTVRVYPLERVADGILFGDGTRWAAATMTPGQIVGRLDPSFTERDQRAIAERYQELQPARERLDARLKQDPKAGRVLDPSVAVMVEADSSTRRSFVGK